MKVFHHNDMDGRCAGAIIAFEEKNYNSNDFFECNYINELPFDKVCQGEKVYLVDYSFTEFTVWQLRKLIEEKECEVIWCDHHDSSISLIRDENSWLHQNIDKIKGIRSTDYCGAVLTWLYFGHNEIPMFLKFVDDYDCWKNKLQPETDYFKLSVDAQKDWATGDFWRGLLKGDIDLQELLEQGKAIKAYVMSDLTRYRKSYGYESVIQISDTETLPCFVVNRRMNSWIFGELINKYPVVSAWTFDGVRYLYSLYSTNPEVDCSKIAERFGGGGHKGAAGFSTRELILKEVKQNAQ